MKVPRNRFESSAEGEGGRGIAQHSLDPALEWGGWSIPRTGRFISRKDPVPIGQEAGWAPRPA
jgi:hypothetical protein